MSGSVSVLSDAGVPAVQGLIDERVPGSGLVGPAQPAAGMDDCSIFYDDDGDAQCDMVSIVKTLPKYYRTKFKIWL